MGLLLGDEKDAIEGGRLLDYFDTDQVNRIVRRATVSMLKVPAIVRDILMHSKE